ncbi:MAG: hypothetical protein KatS3mg050_5021 [Litorilinea sp.]|nr:MAG: hypothetical protein KatS3mg050_5021 [Litorilinea sp.]
MVNLIMDDRQQDHLELAESRLSADQPTEQESHSSLVQIQHRLLRLSTQLEELQAAVDELVDDAQEQGAQVATLVQRLTEPHLLQTVHERLADLHTLLNDNQEQLAQGLQQTARGAELSRMASTMAGREQVAELLRQLTAQSQQFLELNRRLETVARSEQLAELAATLAGREQVAELAEALKRLSRTQFKANALHEDHAAQLAKALATLQEMLARREARGESRLHQRQEEREAWRRAARAEFAAEWLPALDSLDRALASGEALLTQHRQEMAAWQDAQRTPPPPPAEERGSLWQRFRARLAPTPETHPVVPSVTVPAPPPSLLQMGDHMAAWLEGLQLVRERFLALLRAEDIEPIPALHQPFDPHWHVAVEMEERTDVPPNTVVRELRRGYRQGDRVLRFAEVAVARPPTSQQGPEEN